MKIDTNRFYQEPLQSFNPDSLKVDKTKVEGNMKVLHGDNPSVKDGVITRKERDFFIKMFPHNEQQLEKHVVFNRTGRVQTSSFSKGLIVDGRV